MLIRRVAGFVCALLIGLARAEAGVVVLAERGDVLPVCAEGAVPSYAVDDLISYLGAITGGPVRLEASPSAPCVLVSVSAGECGDAPADGGLIVADPGRGVEIRGLSAEGAANCVYTFLQDLCGVRWYGPGELWEHVPSSSRLVVPEGTYVVRPSFDYRRVSGIADVQWLKRCRVTFSSESAPYYAAGHNLHKVVPAAVYGEAHPEYFAEHGGTRMLDRYAQPCFTNPDVIDIATAAAREFFDANPDARGFSLCPNDNPFFCECESCRKLDEPRRHFRGSAIYSESYFHFVSRVAARLQASHPGRYVGTYAYWGTLLPPRGVERLPENVFVGLTQDSSQHFDPRYRDEDRALLAEWCKLAAKVGKYDYYGLGWWTWRTFPHLASADLLASARMGVSGYYIETHPAYAVTAPMNYVEMRMLWDVGLSVDALLDEYVADLYGPAASAMRSFYDLLERSWMTARTGQWFQGLDNLFPEFHMATLGVAEAAGKCLEEAAAAAAGDDMVTRRIAYVSERFEFSELTLAVRDCAQRVPAAGYGELPGLARTLVASANRHEGVRATVLTPDPLYPDGYYRPGVGHWPAKYDAWRRMIRCALGQCALRMAEGMRREGMEPVDAWGRACSAVSAVAGDGPWSVDGWLTPAVTCARAAAGAGPGCEPAGWGVPAIDMAERGIAVPADQGAYVGATSLWLAWDAEALLIAVRTTDEDHVQTHEDGGMWTGDCLQVGVDPLRDAFLAAYQNYSTDDAEIGVALCGRGAAGWAWKVPGPDGRPGVLQGVAYTALRLGDDTEYRVAVPWTWLRVEPRPGMQMGLCLAVNDDDGAGRTVLQWGSDIVDTKEPQGFVPVVLSE